MLHKYENAGFWVVLLMQYFVSETSKKYHLTDINKVNYLPVSLANLNPWKGLPLGRVGSGVSRNVLLHS